MAEWIRYEDSYSYEIRPESSVHSESIFEVELLPGCIATFGENKSKLHSRAFKLVDVYFVNELWDLFPRCVLKELSLDVIHSHRGDKGEGKKDGENKELVCV